LEPPKRLPSNPMRHQKVPLFLKGKFIYKSIKHVVQFINEWKIVTRRKGEGSDKIEIPRIVLLDFCAGKVLCRSRRGSHFEPLGNKGHHICGDRDVWIRN